LKSLRLNLTERIDGIDQLRSVAMKVSKQCWLHWERFRFRIPGSLRQILENEICLLRVWDLRVI
jgi:hypothetical protein